LAKLPTSQPPIYCPVPFVHSAAFFWRHSLRRSLSADSLFAPAFPLTLLRIDTLYHREDHFRGGDTVKDIVIGMSDGLTVPFALAAGISGAISAVHIVVTAGFAEIAAGSIAMACHDPL
jgi:hypothetical protein